jgi:hypothetical protein
VREISDVGYGRAPDADDEPFAREGPLGGLVAALREPDDLGSGVDAAVMAAVRLAPPLAVVPGRTPAAAIFGLRRDADRGGELAGTGEHPIAATGEFPVPAAAPRARDTVFVTRFVLVAPDAKRVALVGDFNDWDRGATPLVPVAAGGQGGVWTVDLPLHAGRYTYAFVVDGHRWEADPSAPRAVGDDFGRPNSVVTVRGA